MLSSRRARPRLSAAVLTLSALGLLAAATLSQGPAPPTDRDPTDWIFVLDASASMTGKGPGAQDVFPKVKETLQGFIRRSKDGDNVFVYTFDEKPELRYRMPIGGEKDRDELADQVMGLTATGKYTHTGKAVDTALDRIRDLQEQNKGKRRTSAIVLFTDGKEDHKEEHVPAPHDIYLRDIPDAKIKEYSPYTFVVVWLNSEQPPEPLKHIVEQSNRGQLIQYSTPSEIPGLVDKVFETFLPPDVKMNESLLEFGDIEPGAAPAKTIDFESTPRGTTLRAALQEAEGGVTLAGPKDVINLEAKTQTPVTVTLQTAKDIPDGPHTGKVIFTVDEVISRGSAPPEGWKREPLVLDYTFKVVRIPLWRKLAPWALGTLLLMGATFVGLCIYYGGLPWKVLRERRYLEGELLIVWPETADGGDRIRLTQVRAPRVRLSELQTGRLREWLGQADAELSTVFEGGKKLVAIERVQGTLSVRGSEANDARLYKDDLIEIGDLKLRFNGLHKRPAAPSEVEFSGTTF